jgi:hypothetical protein
MVIWPVYAPSARFNEEGSAVTVSGSGVVPLSGETLSQLPPEFVEKETVTGAGEPLLVTVRFSGGPPEEPGPGLKKKQHP